MDWTYMRQPLICPSCGRRGAVQRRLGTKPFIEHACPGPFVLAGVERTADRLAGFHVTIHSRKEFL